MVFTNTETGECARRYPREPFSEDIMMETRWRNKRMLAVTSMIIDCGDVDEAVGQNRDADGFHRYHSWVQSPPPQSSLSLLPTNARRGTSTRAPWAEDQASTRAQHPTSATSASRESRVGSWSAGNPTRDSEGSSGAGPSPSTSGLVPSAVDPNRVFNTTGDEMTIHRVWIEWSLIRRNLIFRYI